MSKFWSGVRKAVRISLTKAEAVRDGSSRVVSAREPRRVAEVLAELMDGKCFSFGP